jgi:diguanylate cyclase (GGDEF)-like protein/PAS domain S-box-containing protein
MGNGVSMISLLPVLLCGLFFGFRAGILSAVLFFLLDLFLLVYFQIATFIEVLTSGIVFGAVALVIMGALVGYMSDLRKTLTKELDTRKKMEKELEAQRYRVEEILNQQQDIVCRFTPEFIITYINPIGRNFYQNQITELIGVNLLTLFPEQKTRFIRDFFSRPESKLKPIKFEFPLRNLKREKIFFQWVITPIFGENHQLIEYQAVGRDITENHSVRQMEREQRQVIEALSKSAAIINSSLDMNDVLKRILENISSVVPHDAANIMLVKNQSAKMVQMIGYEKFVQEMEPFQNLEFPLSTPNFHEMILTDKGVIISNTKTDPRWQVIGDNHWIGSYLGAPLLFQKKLIGFINLDSTRTDFYQEKHIQWLQAFADQAAIAIKNAQLYEEVNERAKQLSLLNQAARVTINAITIDEIKRPVVRLIREIFKADNIQFSIWDDQKNEFSNYIESSNPISAGKFTEEDIKFQKHFARQVLENGQLKIFENFQNEESFSETYRKIIPLQSIALIPLKISSQKLGIILLGYDQKKSFQQHEVILMEQFAHQTGLAISKTKMYLTEKERTLSLSHTNDILATISEVAANTTLDLNIHEVLNFLGSSLKKLQIETMIAFKSPNQNGLDIEYISLKNQIQTSEENLQLLKKHFSHIDAENYHHFHKIFTEKKALFINNAIDDIKKIFNPTIQNLDELISLMGFTKDSHAFILPLIVNDQAIGLITVWSQQIQQSDQSTFMILAMLIANVIEKNRLYQKIQQLAITDSLTGFYNRRGLEELGKHEIERAIRFDRPLTTLMIDIDHFKRVNDSFGHPVGDEILIQLAHRLKSKLRDVDILSRYGGEEFFIMLPETDKDNAYIIADRIRKLIDDNSFPTSAGLINITVSIGICYLSKNIYNLEDMVNYADQALYQAKQNGRNNVKHFILNSSPDNKIIYEPNKPH